MAIVKPPDAPVPGQQGRAGGIGELLENTLIRFGTRLLNACKETIAGILRFGLDTFMEGIEPFMIRAYKPILGMMRNAPGCPPALIETIDLALSGTSQAGAGVLAMLGTAASGAVIGSFTSTLTAPLTMYANSKVLPQRPDLATMQALLRRRAINDTRYQQLLGDLGWSDELSSAIGQLTHPRPDIAVMVQNAFRNGQGLDTLKDELSRRGFLPPDIDTILNVVRPLPGPGDLIRMAVREAFTPDIAQKFGLYQDYPGQFGEYMAKQGYSEEWARAWWAAHWDLPSATMGMEMLHRRIIDSGDFATLLRALDVSPYWRPKVESLSYAPYTRVDVRRMFQVGVIKTRAELVTAYKDLGYDDTKAGNLADFTVIEYGETEREATKTDILQAYQIGRLSGAEATGMLTDMGYPEWIIQTYLGRVDLARITKTTNEAISYTKTLYVNGQFSKSDVYTQLGKIPLPSAEIERYLEEWDVPRQTKITRPTRAELRKFFVQGELSETDFRQELAGYRLSEKYVEWYVQDAKIELVQTAKETADKALLEVQRVALARLKTAADIASADIDLDIARLKLAQADLKMAITPEMDYDRMVELETQIANAARQIKVLQVTKAEVKSGYVKEKGAI